MKNKKLALLLGFALLLLGVQGVWAQYPTCAGTVYFKAPDDWAAAYIGGFNANILKKMAKNADGYYEYDLANLGVQYKLFFGIGNQPSASSSLRIVTKANFNTAPRMVLDSNWPTNEADIPCPGEGNVVYVTENPLIEGRTYIGENPPDAKYFYVLVPGEKAWQSDDMMIHYVNAQGVAKDTAMTPINDMCGWYGMVFGEAPTDVIMYLKNTPDMQLGINGLWGDDDIAMPVDLGILYEAYGTNKLYFIPDDVDWPNENDGGWYVTDPGVPPPGDNSRCSFNLAAIIYDTDQSVNPLFSTDGDPSNCLGVQHGLVAVDLGPDNKPVFSGNAKAVACFGNETNFKTLFNYTPGVNEVQCYDMPFRHYGKDTRWGFDSDSMLTNNLLGGFSPLENSTAASCVMNFNGVVTQPLDAARFKRPACGPVPNFADSILGVPLDYYCSTPGWPSGKDCEGFFASGEEKPVGEIWCWGEYCMPGFTRWGDCGMDGGKEEDRNQHFCFESHATFTYNESQEFTFRGDDDIWVFINKKIAVDNGGTHLAAPGHVVLKKLNDTYGAGFLVPGQDYPIDIFFCDRRTTMSNVIIKTNMYIKQTTGIDIAAKKTSSGGVELHICKETSGGGDCASVALGNSGGQNSTRQCDNEIDVPITYSITTRRGENPAGCADCLELPYGPTAGINGVVHGGINLANPKVPIINADKITGLPPGVYYLNIEISGSKERIKFRVRGNLGIVSSDVEFWNVDGDDAAYPTGTKWKFVSTAMAGVRAPIYISAPDDQGGVDLISAAGQNYVLSLSAGATLYKTNDPTDVSPIATPYTGTVNPTGIDTLWVEVPLAGLTAGSQPVTATVGNTSATITFYALTLTFAEPTVKDSNGNVLSWKPITQDPDESEHGDEYFHWVGSDVDLYVIAMNPITNSLCTECTFPIDVVDASAGIVASQVAQVNGGVWLVRIRSNSEYGVNAASMVVAAIENNAIAAPYGNMHFYKPPAPMPILVDIFDVKGETLGEMDIPSEFYNENGHYLDGRADSLAIYYDRPLHKDSLPSFICLNFDESHLTTINPYQMGISNNPKDTEIHCSTQFGEDAVKAAYKRSPDGGRTLVFAGDEPFSVGIKTAVNLENKIYAFTEYEWRGKKVKSYYEKGLTDRIAPVILKARISTETSNGDYDRMKIIVSEPVSVVDASVGSQAFSYYLNSAVDIASESARFLHVPSQGAPQPKKDTLVIRYYRADPQNPTPHAGDHIRFRADSWVWADTSNGFALGADTLRQPSDADQHWNSPTNYNSTTRLPSPWVLVEGDIAIPGEGEDDNIKYAEPSFRIKMTGPFRFAIVMEEALPAKARAYTVMDLQGNILRQGEISSAETIVEGLNSGSYVVKVGLGHRRVNIR